MGLVDLLAIKILIELIFNIWFLTILVNETPVIEDFFSLLYFLEISIDKCCDSSSHLSLLHDDSCDI